MTLSFCEKHDALDRAGEALAGGAVSRAVWSLIEEAPVSGPFDFPPRSRSCYWMFVERFVLDVCLAAGGGAEARHGDLVDLRPYAESTVRKYRAECESAGLLSSGTAPEIVSAAPVFARMNEMLCDPDRFAQHEVEEKKSTFFPSTPCTPDSGALQMTGAADSRPSVSTQTGEETMTTESNALYRVKKGVEIDKLEKVLNDTVAEGFEIYSLLSAGATKANVVFKLAGAAGAAPVQEQGSNVVAMPQSAQTDAAIAAVTTLPDGATVDVETAGAVQQQAPAGGAVMPGAGAQQAAPQQQAAAPQQQQQAWVNPNTEESNAWRNVYQSHIAQGVPFDQAYNTLHADLSASTDPGTATAKLQSFGIFATGMLA